MRGRAFSAHDAEKHNRGIFATRPIRAGTVVGDYLGLLVPNEQEDEYETGPDTYLMYYDQDLSIWPDQTRAGVHIVNHSCEPNCAIATYRGHGLYYALRAIHPGEELTVSYVLGPIDDDCAPCRHGCWCRARSCTGTMHLPIDRYASWRLDDDRRARRAPAQPVAAYQTLQPLARYPARISDRPVHPIFGAAEHPPFSVPDDHLPSVAEVRRLLRRTGRQLRYTTLGLTVLGVDGPTVILEGR
ncbi:MAG: SET domain-containing protein-lysine N-methyltransferase [Chloroflexota bacterium]